MRTVFLANHHPELTCPRSEVVRMVRRLDAMFRFVAADLPWLTGPAVRRARNQALPASDAAGVGTGCVPDGELSLVFLTDPALAGIHAQFLNDPSCTDVITFEGSSDGGTAGEICVSADTAARFAAEHHTAFHEELTLYLVHGWLHLAGYDDLEPRKKRRMRAAEARAMALLRAESLIPRFVLKASTGSRPIAKRKRA